MQSPNGEELNLMKISTKNLGFINQNYLYEIQLSNEQGLDITLLNYGATLTKVYSPDHEGKRRNIVLGLDNPKDYLNRRAFLGCTIGRVAGRITKGTCSGSKEGKIHLQINENGNHLHGGQTGFDTKFWDFIVEEEEDQICVRFSCTSPDGEGGYPGKLFANVCYILKESNELLIEYTAQSDEATLFNPTNHTYFHLDDEKDVLNHELTVASDYYLPLTEESLPTGQIVPVKGSDFDLNQTRTLKRVLSSKEEQIITAKGLNHPFLLKDAQPQILLQSPKSRRQVTMTTSLPAVVIYTGNHFSEEVDGIAKNGGIALETQRLPDAVNHEGFGSIELESNEVFYECTSYWFGVY